MQVKGIPITINGRTAGSPGPATTTVAQVRFPSPRRRLNPLYTFARQMTITNLDGTNNLLVYINGQAFRTIAPNGWETFNGIITSFAVQSSALTVQWEATAIIAA